MSIFGGIDEHGFPVERSVYEYRYSYSQFVTWRGAPNERANSTIYSDRLPQWDYNKYNVLSKKHFGNEGQMFFDRKPEDIQAFLRDWNEDPELELVLIMQCCNQSSGFPLWRFDYRAAK